MGLCYPRSLSVVNGIGVLIVRKVELVWESQREGYCLWDFVLFQVELYFIIVFRFFKDLHCYGIKVD
jgi:hypothetical protein